MKVFLSMLTIAVISPKSTIVKAVVDVMAVPATINTDWDSQSPDSSLSQATLASL